MLVVIFADVVDVWYIKRCYRYTVYIFSIWEIGRKEKVQSYIGIATWMEYICHIGWGDLLYIMQYTCRRDKFVWRALFSTNNWIKFIGVCCEKLIYCIILSPVYDSCFINEIRPLGDKEIEREGEIGSAFGGPNKFVSFHPMRILSHYLYLVLSLNEFVQNIFNYRLKKHFLSTFLVKSIKRHCKPIPLTIPHPIRKQKKSTKCCPFINNVACFLCLTENICRILLVKRTDNSRYAGIQKLYLTYEQMYTKTFIIQKYQNRTFSFECVREHGET